MGAGVADRLTRSPDVDTILVMRDIPTRGPSPRPGPATPSPSVRGLSDHEARERLRRYGPNAVEEERPHPWLAFLGKFWAPVPWMLELAILLELILGRRTEAGLMASLLVFNALVSARQETRSQKALALLRQRLTVEARVRRDDRWSMRPAAELVPGDIIRVRMGDIVPADARILEGALQADQSALTGESLPVDLAAPATAHAGSAVRHGEATAEVTSTGARTYFGKTAMLVRAAKAPSRLESVILGIVRSLVLLDLLLVIAVVLFALAVGRPLAETLPFALILLVASVPVALPATFTLATALGALDLVKRGVLVTRLSAIEDAAGLDLLCTDKTGTLTENRLAVGAVHAYPPYTREDVLRLAALASDEATQDPIDLAILDASPPSGHAPAAEERLRFIPFDPRDKRSEAIVRVGSEILRVVKGAPAAVASLVPGLDAPFGPDVEALSAQGDRVLAIATGPDRGLQVAGLIGLRDRPRADSRSLVQDLRDLGVRTVMVTGDGVATARAIAGQVGIGARACPPDRLRAGDRSSLLECDIFAGVLPEDKFRLVEAFQAAGHVVGMTGDGVNDAPALKQAELGIAVATATDAAKAAASVVLTRPGLEDMVAALATSRQIYQRMLTYTLNKIIKTLEISLVLSFGFLLGGVFLTSPSLVVLLLFTNDFVTMSIATDRVSVARRPERWPLRALVMSSVALAAPPLLLLLGVTWIVRACAGLELRQLQTVVFLMLVFTGQATVYLVRERDHFWRSRPGKWLILSTAVDLLGVGLLATQGWLMAPISIHLATGLLAAALIYLVAGDCFKVVVFRHFRLR